MTINTNKKTLNNHEQKESYSWRVHLAAKHPFKAAFIVISLSIAFVAGYKLIGSFGSCLCILAVLFSLADFFYPIKYELTKNEAIAYYMHKKTIIPWNKIKQCYLSNIGIKLSTVQKDSKLEPFRGLLLYFNNNEEEATAAVKKLWNKQ